MITLFIAKLSLFFFAAPNDSCTLPGTGSRQFFFFPHWWEYLKGQRDQLNICSPHVSFPNDIWLIGLAVLDMLLALAGFIAVISIMLAGAQLILSEGNSEKATNARNRLINSLVGLGIAFSATAAVRLVGNIIHTKNSGGLPHGVASTGNLQSILNAIFAVLGAAAFLFIILAGLRFITAGDNSTKTSEARKQIIFAAAGLVLIALASTIVNFVLSRI